MTYMASQYYREQQDAFTVAPLAAFQEAAYNWHARQGSQNWQWPQSSGRHQQFANFEELAYRMGKPSDTGSCGDSDAPTAAPLDDGAGSDIESSNHSCVGNCSPDASPCGSPKGRYLPATRADAQNVTFDMRSPPMRSCGVNPTPHVEVAGSSPEDFAAAFKAASTNRTTRRGNPSQQHAENNFRPDGRREKGQLKGNLRDRQPQSWNLGCDESAQVVPSLSPCYVRTHEEASPGFGKEAFLVADEPLRTFDCFAPLKVMMPRDVCRAPLLDPTMPVSVILPESL